MDQQSIIRYITENFEGVEVVVGEDGIAAGDTFFFYDPERTDDPTKRLPFATIVTKDYGEFDRTSNLDRPGVFRLNLGVGRDTFRTWAGSVADPAAPVDFAALDQVLPHPVYASQSWLCVLNPSPETFERLQPLLVEAHELAASRRRRRASRDNPQAECL